MTRDTVLLITTSYPESGDGSEAAGAFVADFARELSGEINVRVVAPGSKPGSQEISSHLQIRRFASPGRPLSLLKPSNIIDWPDIVRTLRSLKAEVLAAGEDGRIGHVLACWALPSGWAAKAFSRKYGAPYSVWSLGSDIWTLGRIPVVREVLRSVSRHASNRFADGLILAKDAERICCEPFEFLPSTRQLEWARSRPISQTPPYRLLFLGRWHPNKGIDLLLDALEGMDEEGWERIEVVHIAGGGPMEKLVHQRVESLVKAGRSVELDGFLGREAACMALEEADFLLLPSRIESIPVVFSDAMKMRLPVIAMPVGDLPQLIGTYGVGTVARSIGAHEFTLAIKQALAQPPIQMNASMAKCAKVFTWDVRALCARFGFDVSERGQ